MATHLDIQDIINGQGDYIRLGDGTRADDELMSRLPSYDYNAQQWNEGSDHAHHLTDDGPLYFCGADLLTCQS